MNDNAFTLLLGDCRETLKTIPDGTVQCCVTSPPYFGLRDYGVDGQIGLEETPAEYVARLVEVFKEVRRVLRDDGTLWLNIGDSYAGGNTSGKWREGSARADGNVRGDGARSRRNRNGNGSVDGCKPKDLIGIPWMLAFALRADGWYLRQDIIWAKGVSGDAARAGWSGNPMPESVRDRATKAHEYLFLLSKSPRYFFDHEAFKEPAAKGSAGSRFDTGKTAQHQLGRASQRERTEDGWRNRRSVWTVATRPYKGAHFATFPPTLIEPCILAGSRPGDIVLDPFGGSGTTAGVAIKHGRKAILCELNPDYAALVPDRVASIVGRPAHDNDNDAQISMLEILEGSA